MEPIWGLILFLLVCAVSAVIASKRGNSAILHFLITAALGFLFTVIVIKVTGGSDGFSAGLAGFVGGLAGVLVASMRRSDSARAEHSGSSDRFKKCKFCAEVVKIEAIKCKHCGSDLSG